MGLGRCPSKLSGEYGRHNQERQIIGLFIIFKKAKKMRESSKKQATAAVTPQSRFTLQLLFTITNTILSIQHKDSSAIWILNWRHQLHRHLLLKPSIRIEDVAETEQFLLRYAKPIIPVRLLSNAFSQIFTLCFFVAKFSTRQNWLLGLRMLVKIWPFLQSWVILHWRACSFFFFFWVGTLGLFSLVHFQF